MGGNETKFVVSNVSKMKVRVEIYSRTAGKKDIVHNLEKPRSNLKKKVQDNMKAVIEGGTEYEFILEKSYIGGNVRFIFEDEKEMFLQHRAKKGMIISLSRDVLYSDNLDQPWISFTENGETINHKTSWTKWNKFKTEKDKLRLDYIKTHHDVVADRNKRHDEVDKAYFNHKNVLKRTFYKSLQDLRPNYNVNSDEDEDVLATKKINKDLRKNDTSRPNKVKTNIAKGLTLMKGFVEYSWKIWIRKN